MNHHLSVNSHLLIEEDQTLRGALSALPMLPNLSALSTASPMDDLDDPDDPEAAWRAMGVLLYDHLVEHKVPRNPDCEKVVVPAPNPTDKKRKFQEEEPDTECGEDGYLMEARVGKDLQPGSWTDWLYNSVIVLTNIGQAYLRASYKASEWDTFSPGMSFEERLATFRGNLRAKELFGKTGRLCNGQKNGKESVRFLPFNDKVANNPKEFTNELLRETTHYYLDKGLEICAFATNVLDPEEARTMDLQWPGEPFFYLHLVCSTPEAKGGGLRAMEKLAMLARASGQRIVRFSALPSVIFYYYTKANANFIDRETGKIVPLPPEVEALMGDNGRGVPRVNGKVVWPMSKREAEERRPRRKIVLPPRRSMQR